MKLRTRGPDLLKAIIWARRADIGDGTRRVLLRADANKLDVYGTSTAAELRVCCAGLCEVAGECVVPADPMVAFLATLTGDVDIEVLGSRMDIASDHSIMRLNTHDLSTWPIPMTPTGAGVSLNPDDLTRIERVGFACHHGTERPVLSGVYVADGFATATDAFRAARIPVTVDGSPCLIPHQSMALIHGFLRYAQDDPSICNILRTKATVFLSSPGCDLRIQTLEYEYPKMGRFFEASERSVCEVAREQLLLALSRVAAVGSSIVTLTSPTDGVLALSATDEVLGASSDQLEAQGDRLPTLDLTQALLREAVSVTSGNHLRIGVSALDHFFVRSDDGLDQFIAPRRSA